MSDLKKELKSVIDENEAEKKKKKLEFNFDFRKASWHQMERFLSASHIKLLSVRPCELTPDKDDGKLKNTEPLKQVAAVLAATKQAEDTAFETLPDHSSQNRADVSKSSSKSNVSSETKATTSAFTNSSKAAATASEPAPSKSPSKPEPDSLSHEQLASVCSSLADALGFSKLSPSCANKKLKKDEIGVELTHFPHSKENKSRSILSVAVTSAARGHPKGSIDFLVAPAHTLGGLARLTQSLCGFNVKTSEELTDFREQSQFEAALQCVALNQQHLLDHKASPFVVLTDLSNYFEIFSLTTNDLGDRFVRIERFLDFEYGLIAVQKMCEASEKKIRQEVAKLETITKEDIKNEVKEQERKKGKITNPFKFASGHRESWIPEILEEDDMIDLADLLGGAASDQGSSKAMERMYL